ncbi:MAG: peptide-methionine (S)-S-oxide reductase [Oceanisphaera sp.]|uniref:peptide-methionine (S)-S-oxide reductase MsrA n=1 Tax=Oceanisphaera sp. TaxID=1929979 RepID=UPI003C76BABE
MFGKTITMLLLSFMVVLPAQTRAAQAVFAGGSFWVMEALFANRAGVTDITVGWVPTSSREQRRQAVRLEYDPQHISYGKLLTLYWAAIDAFDGEGQFCDRGQQYSPALYVQTALQQRFAQQSRAKIALEQDKRVRVRILPAGSFTPAAKRHQQYYQRHSLLYGGYRRMCGYPAGERLTLSALAGGPFATSAQ